MAFQGGGDRYEFTVDPNTDEAERKLRDLEELSERATQDREGHVDVETGQAERALERTEEAADQTEGALSRLNGQIQEIPLIGDAFRALQNPVAQIGGLVAGLALTIRGAINDARELTILAGAGGLTGPEAVAVQRAAERVGAEPQPLLTSLTQLNLRREELLAGTISDEEGAVLAGLGVTPGLARELDQFQFAQLVLEQASRLPPRQVGTALERLGADEELAGFIRPDIVGPERTLQRLLAQELAAAPTQEEFAASQLAAQGSQDFLSRVGQFTQRFGQEVVQSVTNPFGFFNPYVPNPLGPGVLEQERRRQDLIQGVVPGRPGIAPVPSGAQSPFLANPVLNLAIPEEESQQQQPLVIQTFIGDEQLDTVVSESQLRNTQRGRNDGAPNWGDDAKVSSNLGVSSLPVFCAGHVRRMDRRVHVGSRPILMATIMPVCHDYG